MLPFRKAQAAMEFLMTYGWAILVVLVVIGALAYFGVLSPATLLPEKCTFPTQFGCADFEVGSNGLQLVLQNGGGKDIKVTSLVFSSDALKGICGTGTVNAVVKNGEKATFYANDPLNCEFKDTGRSKNRYSAEVTYSFRDSTIPHTASGELFARKGDSTISGGEGTYGGESSDPSLVGYWNFNEGSGTSASDSSDQGNTGTLNNFECTTLDCNSDSGWVSGGKVGKALAFDGGNDYVNVVSSASLSPTSAITVEAWVYIPSPTTANSDSGIVGKDSYIYKITSDDRSANKVISFYINSGSNRATITLPSSAQNAWHHIAGTYDGTTIKIYLDAVKGTDKALSSTINPSGSPVTIGNNGAQYFKGRIDEVRIYNRALSPQEIAALAS